MLSRNLQVPERLAGFAEEHVVVSNDSGSFESGAHGKLSPENRQRSRAQYDSAIFAGFRLTSVDADDPCLVDADDPVHEVEVGQNECDLFGRPQSSEEPTAGLGWWRASKRRL
jgi:hypothetical protein